MCDACLCPECRSATSLKEIVPYKINEGGETRWMCSNCWPIRSDKTWIMPDKDILSYVQMMIWGNDDLSQQKTVFENKQSLSRGLVVVIHATKDLVFLVV